MAVSLVPITLACFLAAANAEGVHPLTLFTVLSVEGGQVGEVSKNANGSVDIGPMQINDKAWLGEVARQYFDGDRDRAFATLRDDGCENVRVGAWILRRSIAAAGGDVYEGIGYYHSRSSAPKQRYQERFRAHFIRDFYDSLGLGERTSRR
jgi:hypothetical protein